MILSPIVMVRSSMTSPAVPASMLPAEATESAKPRSSAERAIAVAANWRRPIDPPGARRLRRAGQQQIIKHTVAHARGPERIEIFRGQPITAFRRLEVGERRVVRHSLAGQILNIGERERRSALHFPDDGHGRTCGSGSVRAGTLRGGCGESHRAWQKQGGEEESAGGFHIWNLVGRSPRGTGDLVKRYHVKK